ncbi:MAG: hypothetical protein WKF52_04175 [Sphingomicrobium sp.]
MNGAGHGGMSWTARLLIAFALILLGAAAATWGLARYQSAARVLGVAPRQQQAPAQQGPQPQLQQQSALAPTAPPAGVEAAVADLQLRLQRVENATAQAQGSAGRADALLVAFAARRSIDRGVGLGYLEPFLMDRFGVRHPQAISTIVTTSRSPVRLADLVGDYESLKPSLLAAGPKEGFWTSLQREVGSLIHVHRADRPSTQPQARYERALAQLSAGQVDGALAETMRLPGAARANQWIAKARQYVSAHRALDEIESAALLGNSAAR